MLSCPLTVFDLGIHFTSILCSAYGFSANSISSICNGTLYPQVCSSTLNGTDPNNPQKYVRVAIEAAMQAINDSLNAVDALLASSPVKNGTQYSTLLTCEEVLSDSLDQLNDSLSQISTLSLQFLQSEVQDVQQLLSAAMTSQDTCLTDIQEFGIWNSTSVVNGTLATYATQLLSNALALVTTLTKITGLTNLIPSLHNRRRLLLLSAADDDAHLAQSKSSYQMELDLHSAIEGGSQAFPGWMRAADRRLLQTVKPTPNAVVAQDGSGHYNTIQAAVNAAKTGTNSRWVIYVKAGTYSEQVTIGKSAKNLMLYGDGAGLTILTGSKSVAGGSTTFLSATLAVKASGFIAMDMTIRNTAGPNGHQAVAMRIGGDQSAFAGLSIEGYQDTLYAYTLRQFYTDCSILGTVDYIFGNSAAVFQNCKLLARTGIQGSQNTYTASGRTDPAQPTGFSFLSCTLEAAVPAASTWPTYLGRPWKPYARTVFIESTLGSLIEPAGWLLWNGDQQSGDKVTYGEYSNTGPGSNTARRVRWSMQLTSKQAFTYTVGNFIDGENWLPATSISFSSNL
ncbi:unnamed protein product [Sphagnum troendelagicum]|uniref:Pectinesterase n=1 Tax=Sphagnum troendelagicum TaxID=128251 RepID=A0ABP0V0C1_9BRYO